MSTEIVAWAQCRAANGQLRNFCGFVKGEVDDLLNRSAANAVSWAQDASQIVDSTIDGIANSIIRLQNSGTEETEYIPLPRIYGEVSQDRIWQRLVTITGVANIYGICISCAPDASTGPPGNPLPINGSIVFRTATFEPPYPLYNLIDMGGPRYDFCKSLWFGYHDKPINAFTTPWALGLDEFCVPKYLEGENWNCNIPIAKYRVPPEGFAIWGFWAEQSPPKLKVTVITAPEVEV